jgi:hypothetical protein
MKHMKGGASYEILETSGLGPHDMGGLKNKKCWGNRALKLLHKEKLYT